MADTTTTDNSLLDIISQSNGLGTLSASYADLLSGFNHRSLGSAIPHNTEGAGIVFFTRPNMNLSYDNLFEDRLLSPLATNNQMTYQRVIRAMMDPVGSLFDPSRGITSPLFDEKQAFMPLLTNGLLSLQGWPDISLDTYTSKEGVLRENWSMVDGTSKNYNTFDLSASFRNYGGDPITLLLVVWATYMDHIHRGVMVPYMKNIVTNRVDYQSRIFRFTLDPSRTRIQKWCSTTGVFPVGVPIGAAMNFSSDEPYSHDNAQEIACSFRCHGAEYLDPILFYEFNETVQMFNGLMQDDTRESFFVKVPYQHLKLFNYKGYPRVNVETSELEWWVANSDYQSRLNNFNSLKPSTQTGPSVPVANSAANGSRPSGTVDPSSIGWGSFLNDMNSNTTGPSSGNP